MKEKTQKIEPVVVVFDMGKFYLYQNDALSIIPTTHWLSLQGKQNIVFGSVLYIDGQRKVRDVHSKVTGPLSKIKATETEVVVFEEHKSLPWRFDVNGQVLNNAAFTEKDIAYLNAMYGLGNNYQNNLDNYNTRVSTRREVRTIAKSSFKKNL